ncbi:MAG: non-ribosomal peptide synthetase, partial [Firmicutes bacterium]|nr:non-ribosomal peptide synthetase [Bacillota bacterium]
MLTTDFLIELNKLDIKLWVEDNRLKYSAPEGALSDDLKAEIIKRKPEIITYLQQTVSNQQDQLTQIQTAPSTGKLPLSYAQKSLWLYEQIESNSFAFNIPTVLRMKGKLVLSALEASINEIIKRHEILRTVIISEENELYQKVLLELTIALSTEDLQILTEEEREKKVYEYFNEQTQQPFNLETGPYLRFKLFQLKADEYALVFTFHHSISDNWSLNIFITELAALYKAAYNKEKAVLPELAIQYADYAVWQQNYLKSKHAESKFNYWKEQLKDIDQIPSLPTDYSRPAVQSRRSIRKFKIIPEKVIQKLKTLSQKEGCSLYVTLLAAFKVLLHQYTGLEDLIVGSPVAGRTRKELEGLIGFFINTV